MRVTRRTFMWSGGAAIAAAGGLVPVWAQASVTVGGYQIDTLSDGNLVLPGSMVIGDLPAEEATAILARYDLGTEQFTPDCNVTLLRDGENTVLFGVGAGANFQSSGPVTYLCRPQCSFRPLGVRKPRGFCLPMLSADGAGYRSR